MDDFTAGIPKAGFGAQWCALLAPAIEMARTVEQPRIRTLSIAEAVAWEWDVASGASGPSTDWLDAVHPEDRLWLHGAVDAALRGERPYDIEFRLLRPNGTVEWVRDRGRLERDIAGRPLRLSGIAQLITAQKRNEAMFAATFEQAAVGMAHIGIDGSFLRVNDCLCRLLGRTAWRSAISARMGGISGRS